MFFLRLQHNRFEACELQRFPVLRCERYKARYLCSLAPGSTDYQGCSEIKTKCNYCQEAGSSTCLSIFHKAASFAFSFSLIFLSSFFFLLCLKLIRELCLCALMCGDRVTITTRTWLQNWGGGVLLFLSSLFFPLEWRSAETLRWRCAKLP